MKVLVVLALALTTSAFAGTKFADCTGDHHGTYLEFHQAENGQYYIETSNDSDAPAVRWEITSVTRDQRSVPAVGRSWSIRQAIKAANAQDGSYGQVIVRAENDSNSYFFVQLNKLNTGDSFLSIDGDVEAIVCR